jgi:hypothetical protein
MEIAMMIATAILYFSIVLSASFLYSHLKYVQSTLLNVVKLSSTSPNRSIDIQRVRPQNVSFNSNAKDPKLNWRAHI